MKELIITIIVTAILAVISQMVNLSNAICDSILKLIPVLIPTVVYFVNTPKNYLKLMKFKRNLDITCFFKANFKILDLDKAKFKNILNTLTSVGNDNLGIQNKIIEEEYGEEYFDATLKIKSSFFKVVYNVDLGTLYFELEGEVSYNSFFKRVEVLKDSIVMALNGIKYDDKPIYRLSIYYKGDEETTNPFIAKIFKDFDKKIVDFKFQGKKGSKISITNKRVEFTNSDLRNLNYDLNHQMNPFNLAK